MPALRLVAQLSELPLLAYSCWVGTPYRSKVLEEVSELNNCGPFLEFPYLERILVAAAIPILVTAIVPASSPSLGLEREPSVNDHDRAIVIHHRASF